jgi:phage shock protein A
MPDSDPSAANSTRIYGEFPDEGPVREFATVVANCERELMSYRAAVTKVQSSLCGLRTVWSLDKIESEHDQLIRRIAELRSACIEESLESVSEIEATKSADRTFRSFVRDGTATDAVESLDETAARIERQIEDKRTVAIARLSLTVAIVSLLVSTLILLSGGLGLF